MIEAADMPGVNLSFSSSETQRLATRGRAIDHIGFDVEDLEAVVGMLAARGIPSKGPRSSCRAPPSRQFF